MVLRLVVLADVGRLQKGHPLDTLVLRGREPVASESLFLANVAFELDHLFPRLPCHRYLAPCEMQSVAVFIAATREGSAAELFYRRPP